MKKFRIDLRVHVTSGSSKEVAKIRTDINRIVGGVYPKLVDVEKMDGYWTLDFSRVFSLIRPGCDDETKMVFAAQIARNVFPGCHVEVSLKKSLAFDVSTAISW
jgi:hypothetical protein